MNTRTDLIPLRELLRNEEEDAVFNAAFGTAYAACILRGAAVVQERLGGREECTHLRAVEAALEECTPVPNEARLIAQAAVLAYRGLP